MTTRLAAAALAATLLPSAALACGGFFCSSTPVDQQAERIIFVQEDAQTVRSIVEIQYQGDPASFAWVVPVPAIPELDTFYGSAFNALDLATEPQFMLPPECQQYLFDGAPSAAGGETAEGDNGVEVLDRQVVGPFDTVTVASDDPRALIEWLRTNGYRIPEAMEPFIALYTAENMKFLAMKLLPGEGTDAIRPISMRYAAANPAVPLRLTSVAALLEMGVKVFILGEGRFGPANVPEIAIADNEVRFDMFTYQSNYVPLVARKVDALRGPGFVTELAGPTHDLAESIRNGFVPEWADQEVRDGQAALADLLDAHPYLTRLYTRVSPEEMFIDPIFAATAGGDVNNVHTLPVSSVDHCQGPGDPQPVPGQESGGSAEDAAVAARDLACAYVSCGASGQCALVADPQNGANATQPACACAEGTLARAVPDARSPYGVGVLCGDARMNFTNPDAPGTDDPFADPCAAFSCGEHGECVSLNGSPSCRCETGFASVARLQYDGGPAPMLVQTCETPTVPIADDFFVATAVPEPQLPYPGRNTPLGTPAFPHDAVGRMTATSSGGGDGGCSVAGAPGGRTGGASALAGLLALLGLRLRRRLSSGDGTRTGGARRG